jgi:hypothetical protein
MQNHVLNFRLYYIGNTDGFVCISRSEISLHSD